MTVAAREARINADYAGVLLGRALEEKLGKSYEKDLHFIGHSYGTVVNGIATRYLDTNHVLDNANVIQFTTLDSPTDAPLNAAPDLNNDWFYNNLSSKVDYMDNYYGTKVTAFGEPIKGAGINQAVDYGHSDVAQKFYPDLVEDGPKADTNPFDLDQGEYFHQFRDWITPVLPTTYNQRFHPNVTVTIGNDDYWRQSIDYQRFNAAINRAYFSAELPGYSEYGFNGLIFNEQSPVSIYYALNVPIGAEWLYFDWMVDSGGDGDWITVHFGSDLLWSMGISDFLEGILLNALLDIRTYAGQFGNLWFTLNSIGDVNASFYIGNLEFRGSNILADSAIPEPATLALLYVGLLGLYWTELRRKYRFN